MKKTFLLLTFFLLITLMGMAQTEGISYQAVILDQESMELPGTDLVGNFLSNGEVTLRFSIIDAATQALVYQEEQSTMTDAYGHIALVIGQGTQTGGYSAFTAINWNGAPMSLRVALSYDAVDYEDLGDRPLYYIPYAAHRNITASATLDVLGDTRLHGELAVSGGSLLNGQLVVNNESLLNGETSVDGPFSVVGHPTDLLGQVTIDAGMMSGADSDVDAYALRVQGAQQGVVITVDGGRMATKNFLTFRDEFGAHGCIEGQTLTELNNSFRFIWDNVMAGLDEGFAVAEAVACGFNVPPDGAEVASNTAQAIAAYAQWIELASYATTNVGVNFSSGGADYAEWLEKVDPTDDLQPGEVVGIVGGRISRATEGAHELKVISTKPLVVGNRPEESALSRYAQVAFLGQAPVRVVGPVSEGDYILPSTHGDGLAKAFAPDELATWRFSEIIGVAWESGRRSDMNVVNMGIGLHSGELADRVADLESEVYDLKAALVDIRAAMSGQEVEKVSTTAAVAKVDFQPGGPAPREEKHRPLSDADFERWLGRHGAAFEEVMTQKREYLQSIGSDYSAYPEAVALLEEPVQALRDMRSGKFMHSLWRSLEGRIVD